MKKQNLTTKFVSDIKREIISGRWKAGEFLPSFRDLSIQYAVSRSVINTAAAILEDQGYIELVERQGALVCNIKESMSLTILNDLLAEGQFDSDRIDAFYNILHFVLVGSIQDFVSIASIDEYMQLKQISADTKKSTDSAFRSQKEFEFISTIVSGSQNKTYQMLFDELEEAIKSAASIYEQDQAAQIHIIELQENIVQAISQRDKQRAKWEIENLLDTVNKYLQYNTIKGNL